MSGSKHGRIDMIRCVILRVSFLLSSLFSCNIHNRAHMHIGPPGHCPRSRTALASPFCCRSLLLSSLPPPLSFPGIPQSMLYAPQNASPLPVSLFDRNETNETGIHRFKCLKCLKCLHPAKAPPPQKAKQPWSAQP